MGRALYGWLVRLHPVSFRLRFEEELTLVFDEAEDSWGAGFLIGDAAKSLVRQWLEDRDVWRWIAAGAAGIFLLAIAFGSFLPWDRALNR